MDKSHTALQPHVRCLVPNCILSQRYLPASYNTMDTANPTQSINLIVYAYSFHIFVQNVLTMVVGRRHSPSKVRLQRWTPWYIRVNFLSDIALRTQARRKSLVARRYYLEFSIGDTSQSTNSAKEAKNHTSWDKKIFNLWVHGRCFVSENSMLLVTRTIVPTSS